MTIVLIATGLYGSDSHTMNLTRLSVCRPVYPLYGSDSHTMNLTRLSVSGLYGSDSHTMNLTRLSVYSFIWTRLFVFDPFIREKGHLTITPAHRASQ
ncbi:MAG: hypothetical protein HY028_05760 [Gammaproteobacteria bacterium]|nr:hypothetical protein [Gammaproteobacteria bacterium]